MKIDTGTGDDGTTSWGAASRLSKDDSRIEVLGCLDELSSSIGFAACTCSREDTVYLLRSLQGELFSVAPSLMGLKPEGSPRGAWLDAVKALERQIDLYESDIELHGFVLPGAVEASGRLDLARTTCRRLERRLVSLSREHAVDADLLTWVNRLSDLLFLLARDEEGPCAMITYRGL